MSEVHKTQSSSVRESARPGHEVGLEVLDAMRVRAWFRDVDLGVLETLPEGDVSCFDRVVASRRRGAH